MKNLDQVYFAHKIQHGGQSTSFVNSIECGWTTSRSLQKILKIKQKKTAWNDGARIVGFATGTNTKTVKNMIVANDEVDKTNYWNSKLTLLN